MARVVLQLDESVQRRWAEFAKHAGHESVEAFLEDKLSSEVAEDYGAPPHLTFNSQEELEAMLLESINDPRPSIEYTPELFREIKRRVLGEDDAKGK